MTEQLELTPEQKDLLSETLTEISASMARQEAERDLIKARKKTIIDEIDIPAKVLNRLVKTFHKGNYNQEQTEHKHFEELYLTLQSD